jgi:hypothetical protein
MKRTRVLTFLLALSFGSDFAGFFVRPPAAQFPGRADRQETTLGQTNTPSPSPARLFTGEIDGRPVTMNLSRSGRDLTGSYRFNDAYVDVSFAGQVYADSSVLIREYADKSLNPTGWFTGEWWDGEPKFCPSISGNWSTIKHDPRAKKFGVSELFCKSGIRLVPDQITEDNQEIHQTINAEFPQIVEPSISNAQIFNRFIGDLATRDIPRFKRFAAELSPEDMGNNVPSSYYSASYDVLFANRDLITIAYVMEEYRFPVLHPVPFFETCNFSLKKGRQLKLSDLFRRGSGFMQVISARTVRILIRDLRYPADWAEQDDWFRRGTAPILKNYQNWAIAKRGLLIYFDTYSIGPGAMGSNIVTIPWSDLKDVLDPNGPARDLQ